MNCEFRYINSSTCKNTEDLTVIKTVQGGEVRHCDNPACIALVNVRETEVNNFISGQKIKETARLESEYRDLRTELDKGVYGGMSDEDTLSRLADSNNGTPVDSPVVSAVNVKSCLDEAEYLALTNNQKTIIDMYATGGYLDLSNGNVISVLDGIYPVITTTRIALEALRVQKQSIGSNLKGRLLKQEDIERARLL